MKIKNQTMSHLFSKWSEGEFPHVYYDDKERFCVNCLTQKGSEYVRIAIRNGPTLSVTLSSDSTTKVLLDFVTEHFEIESATEKPAPIKPCVAIEKNGYWEISVATPEISLELSAMLSQITKVTIYPHKITVYDNPCYDMEKVIQWAMAQI